MVEQKPKRGRPRVQHIKHVHVIALSPKLEEKIDSIREAYILNRLGGRTIEAIGRAASHPVGFAVVSGAIIALLIKLGLMKDEIAAIQELAEGTASAFGKAAEEADFILKRAWCRFRVMLARPFIGEEEYLKQVTACGSESPTETEDAIRVATASQERERIQRERVAVPP